MWQRRRYDKLLLSSIRLLYYVKLDVTNYPSRSITSILSNIAHGLRSDTPLKAMYNSTSFVKLDNPSRLTRQQRGIQITSTLLRNVPRSLHMVKWEHKAHRTDGILLLVNLKCLKFGKYVPKFATDIRSVSTSRSKVETMLKSSNPVNSLYMNVNIKKYIYTSFCSDRNSSVRVSDSRLSAGVGLTVFSWISIICTNADFGRISLLNVLFCNK